jgi:hypothetical protein
MLGKYFFLTGVDLSRLGRQNMTTENVDHKLDRRDFLKMGATVGAGIFLAPYPVATGPTSTVATLATPALSAVSEQESEFSATIPLHAWSVYGELFAQFKAMYPAITILAVIP